MGVPVYKRILDLFEAEGINTLFGIPDPNFVHMFAEAEARGWSVVAPHHELSAGFMAEAASRMTGKPGLCIGTLGPGVANISGAMMCALVENSPVIFLGGQRARITERRVRRGRIQFVQQEGLFTPSVKYSSSIEYADQTDEIVHEAIRRSMSGTPGPSYIEFPSHVILEELDVAEAPEPSVYRLVNQGAGAREVAEAAKLIREAKSPILLVGHGVHTSRTQAEVKELAELMACPVIQTSGGTSFIPGLQDRTFPYLFSPAANQAVEESDLCVALGTELGEPMHYGRTQHWASNDANRKWVYVEQDPTAIGVNRRFDVPLVGDLRGVVPQLVEALRGHPARPVDQPRDSGQGRRRRAGAGGRRGPKWTHPGAPGALRGRGDQGVRRVRQGRHHGARRWRDRHLPVDLLADQAARCDLEPELRSSRHGSALRRRRLGRRGPQAAGDAADQRLGVPVPHRRARDGGARGPAAGMRRRCRPPVGPRGRRLQAHLRAAARRSRACTGARTCASTRSPRASAATANTSRRRTRSARRSSGHTPAARPPSCTSASTRRRTPRRCRSTTDSEPGMQKALSREGLETCVNI